MQTSAHTTHEPAAAVLITLPTLAEGERYAGIVIDPDTGRPSHHLILLRGSADALKWQDATQWAEQAGGTLPTRQEQALLYANCKAEFASDWYWSSEQHAGDEAFAWCQYVSIGNQYNYRKDDELRARAVRRLAI